MIGTEAVIAANRFGLGARPGEFDRIAADPKAWIRGQITAEDTVAEALRALTSSAEMLKRFDSSRHEQDLDRRRKARKRLRRNFWGQIHARLIAQARTDQPFRERMVLFWSNHFTASSTKGVIATALAAYEREAIRPHVFGRYRDMLKAVAHHPAMLIYLDNHRSIGPDSWAGKRRKRGLNENLAREILELHTLGVRGGYGQADVTEFAKALTGWTVGAIRPRRGPMSGGAVTGAFEYRPAAHEPGAKTLLGKRYEEAADTEALAILDDLASHPATARFIATKLARHFVADDPPGEAVYALERVFRETDGDLAAVSRALIELDGVWREPLPKVRTPYELIVATLRASGLDGIKRRDVQPAYRALGQIPFRAPSPAGWPDRAKDWVSPPSVMSRIEWARSIAARLPRSLNPAEVLEWTLGPVASEPLRDAVTNAPSGEEALALLFASPEFQRR